MIYLRGYYSMGLCGYELWVNDDDLLDDTMHVLFVGTNREQKARRYKIQVRNKDGLANTGHRQFVRPHGRRIYLDECIRCNYPN